MRRHEHALVTRLLLRPGLGRIYVYLESFDVVDAVACGVNHHTLADLEVLRGSRLALDNDFGEIILNLDLHIAMFFGGDEKRWLIPFDDLAGEPKGNMRARDDSA